MTETTSVRTDTTESVAEFAERARAWLADNLPRVDPANPPDADRGEEGPWLRARELQKKLYEGWIRRHLLPARIRRDGTSDRIPEGVRH